VAFRVLVAGGAGLVGSAVARQLLSEGAEVVVADAMGLDGDGRDAKEARVAALRAFPKSTFVAADLTLPGAADELFRELAPAAVVNAALFPPGGPGVEALAEAIRSHGEPFLVHLSDGALYGPPSFPGQPAAEDEALEPGNDALLLQRIVEEDRLRASGIPHVVLRLFPLLAPGPLPRRFPHRELEALLDGSEVVLPTDTLTDLLHLRDAVHGILAALALRPAGRTVNLASGTGVAPSRVVRLLAEKAFRTVRIRVADVPFRPNRVASAARAGELLRFRPRTPLEASLDEIVAARLGAPEISSSRPGTSVRPASPASPSAGPASRAEEPREVSRRELFGFFRRPFDDGKPR